MDPKPELPKERSSVLSMLNVAIEDLNLAKNESSVASAKAVFGDVGDLLPTIRVSPSQSMFANRLLMVCAGFNGRQEGLCQVRPGLCKRLWGPGPGIERRTGGSVDSVCARGD